MQTKDDRSRSFGLSREIRFDIFADIAKEVETYLFVDMAHIAGLVAAGLHRARFLMLM